MVSMFVAARAEPRVRVGGVVASATMALFVCVGPLIASRMSRKPHIWQGRVAQAAGFVNSQKEGLQQQQQ